MEINWSEGKWQADAADSDSDFRISVAGDWAPLRKYEKLMLAEPEGIYGDLLENIRRSDLRIVNVEAVLGDAGEPGAKDGPNLRADAGTVRCLEAGQFHIACLANNHCLDYGREGLARTMELLRASGMETVGAGLDSDEVARPLAYTAAGRTITVINCTEGEESRARDGGAGAYGLVSADVEKQIAEAKESSDIVLVIFHGGRERAPVPPPYVVDDLRRFADAGADAVIGHHPHVPQGIEIHNGVPIFYSLGNFMFLFENDHLFQQVGYLTHLDFGEKGLAGFEITPYLVLPWGMKAAAGELRGTILRGLHGVSDLLVDPQAIRDAWDAFIDVDFGGTDGQIDLLARHIETYRSDPARGSQLLLNLFYTPGHRELFIRGLGRTARREPVNTPQWAKDLVARWTKFPCNDLPDFQPPTGAQSD